MTPTDPAELRATALYLAQPPDDADPYKGPAEMRRYVSKALGLADAVLALLPPPGPADDESYGRAWAKQQGKRPRHLGASVAPDDVFVWYSDAPGHPPDAGAALLPAVLMCPMARVAMGAGIYPTEAECFAALGAAVRAVHLAVPPLASPGGPA